jgi:hypothetical protein
MVFAAVGGPSRTMIFFRLVKNVTRSAITLSSFVIPIFGRNKQIFVNRTLHSIFV